MDGIESKRRNQPAEESLAVWKEMVAGSAEGKRFCMRFKINMQVPHVARTGTVQTTALTLQTTALTCAPLSACEAAVASACWGSALRAACCLYRTPTRPCATQWATAAMTPRTGEQAPSTRQAL